VRPGQRKSRGVVVKRSGGPSGNGMTSGTRCRSGWETRSDVVGHIATDGSGALERRRVTAIAIRGIQCVVAVDVAGRARCRKVCTHKSETCGAVVERSSGPRCDRMARGALCGGSWEARAHVIRYISANCRGALESCRVAAVAVGGIQCVVVIGMAGSAGRRSMRPCQRKSGNTMVERCRIPTSRSVAVGAIPHCKGRTSGRMHRIIGSLPGSQMAL
jgi:hypothetical protein